eukprot:354050-Chlamydomonas_euryale.AAC.5
MRRVWSSHGKAPRRPMQLHPRGEVGQARWHGRIGPMGPSLNYYRWPGLHWPGSCSSLIPLWRGKALSPPPPLRRGPHLWTPHATAPGGTCCLHPPTHSPMSSYPQDVSFHGICLLPFPTVPPGSLASGVEAWALN